MNLLELQAKVNRAVELAGWRAKDIEVGVVVRRDFSVGATPRMPVIQVGTGIDWDSDQFMIWPSRPLKEIDK